MMEGMNITRVLITAAVPLLLASGCSLEAKKGPSLLLRVDLDSDRMPSPFQFANPIRALAAPSTVDGFACLGVNVMGPGIPDSSTNPEGSPEQIFAGLQQGSYCSYRGIIAGPFYKNSSTNTFTSIDTTLKIPSGSVRMIQVLGTTDTVACSSAFRDDTPNQADDSYFELARTFLPAVFSDRSETLTTNWNSLNSTEQAARSLDCGNGSGSCSSQYQSTTYDTTYGMTTGKRIAFRFTVPAGGTYLNSFTLRLSAASAQNIGVTIYPELSTDPDTGASAIGSSQFANVQAEGDYTASFGSGKGLWILAASATNYWLTIIASGSFNIHQDGMATPETARIKDFSSVWVGHTSGLPRHDIRTCSN